MTIVPATNIEKVLFQIAPEISRGQVSIDNSLLWDRSWAWALAASYVPTFCSDQCFCNGEIDRNLLHKELYSQLIENIQKNPGLRLRSRLSTL